MEGGFDEEEGEVDFEAVIGGAALVDFDEFFQALLLLDEVVGGLGFLF